MRAHPARFGAVVARAGCLSVAEVAMTAMQRMAKVVSVALVFHKSDA